MLCLYSIKTQMKLLFPPVEASEKKPVKPSPLETTFESWKIIKKTAQQQLPQEDFTKYIQPLQGTQPSLDSIVLFCSDKELLSAHRQTIEKHINSCKRLLGLEFINISFETSSNDTPNKNTEPTSSCAVPTKEAFVKKLSKDPKLNPFYTFRTFVKGPSNQFALATCLSVAENPGANYNPLFLYGSTGLGKTHLLHAVGNLVVSQRPDMVVTYISSERFMNEMIYCIRHNKMWDFRQKYRNCDVFMVDDIQFISGNKAATQEEFFHTFNTLYEAKKQIIITSDLFPQDIPDIEERLRNRFQWGLIADIQPPDIEHRIAILMNKAEKLDVKISYEVAEFIAKHAKRNIRELEGALHRIAAFSALHARPLDLSLALETFKGIPSKQQKNLDVDTVQKIVAEHFQLRKTDLRSKKRKRSLSVPRQIAMFLSRKHTHASYPEIGTKFGGKDHSTVMHAVKKIGAQKAHDPDIKAALDCLERKLELTYP
jgi:chromosomal replication initiator protein